MSLLEMSITGGVMVLVATVLRSVLLNKLPKRAFIFLWELAMLRLILPISVPSVFSIYTLFNQMGTSETIETAQETFTNAPAVGNLQAITVPAGTNTFSAASVPVWTIVWLAGMAISLAIFIVGYVNVFRKYRYAVLVKSGYPVEWLFEQKNRRKIKICLSSETSTPLTYGIFHPTILLPENIDTEKSERLTYILTHEMIHGGFDYYKDDNGNSLKWARLYYQISYHISDKKALTVGERDRCIGNFISEIKSFWDNTSLDELLKMSENDVVAYMQKTVEQFCGKNLTIHIDEDDVLFEGKDEQAYQSYIKEND